VIPYPCGTQTADKMEAGWQDHVSPPHEDD